MRATLYRPFHKKKKKNSFPSNKNSIKFFFSFIRDKLLLNILTSNRSKECTRHVYETIKGTYTKYNNKITEVEEGFPETGTVSTSCRSKVILRMVKRDFSVGKNRIFLAWFPLNRKISSRLGNHKIYNNLMYTNQVRYLN